MQTIKVKKKSWRNLFGVLADPPVGIIKNTKKYWIVQL